jgi:hypothetical protein
MPIGIPALIPIHNPVQKVMTGAFQCLLHSDDAMISTVHLDRHGYVVEVFHNTRIPQLDAGKYVGTLMEVEGPIAPGMRWDGQTFVIPPARVPLDAVVAEKERRAAMFPERLVKLITTLGGDNALKVSKYLGELHNTAERMTVSEPPADYKDDRYWPAVPELIDMPVAHRFHDVQSVSPVSGPAVTIAPVFNVAGPAAAQPLVIQSPPAERVVAGGFALDPSDPLYHRKLALIGSIAMYDERNGIPDAIEPAVTAAALKATAAQSAEELSQHESRVRELLEAA